MSNVAIHARDSFVFRVIADTRNVDDQFVGGLGRRNVMADLRGGD
tara:strand:- start:7903 stop:8037 length:135 start_codon:yes stop_codon:yes gene_type:complete